MDQSSLVRGDPKTGRQSSTALGDFLGADVRRRGGCCPRRGQGADKTSCRRQRAHFFLYEFVLWSRDCRWPNTLRALIGRKTAEVAVRILGGERAGDIKTAPVEFAPPKFDWREMRRWGISENIQLPPGSVIHFREATIWEQHRQQILAIFAVLLLQSAMIGWLLYEHRRRRQSEAAARRSEVAAHALSGRLIAARMRKSVPDLRVSYTTT